MYMTTTKPPGAHPPPFPRLRHVPLSGGDVRDIVIEAVDGGLVLTFLPSDPKAPVFQARLTTEEARALASAVRSEKGAPQPKPSGTSPPGSS